MMPSAPGRGWRSGGRYSGTSTSTGRWRSTTAFTAPFQDLITRYAWGEIWSRPGLARAERSIVTLAVLAALQHENELAMHVKAALRNGLSAEQIQEVLLQVALYAGVPAGNRAFAVAQRALAEVRRSRRRRRGRDVAAPAAGQARDRFTGVVNRGVYRSLFPGISSLAAELARGHSQPSDRRTSVLMASAKAVSFC